MGWSTSCPASGAALSEAPCQFPAVLMVKIDMKQKKWKRERGKNPNIPDMVQE